MMGWPHVSGIAFQAWGMLLQKAVYTLNQCSVYGAVSPTTRTQGARNPGLEMGVAVIPRDPLAEPLLPVLVALCSAGLESLVPEVAMLSPGDAMITLNWKFRLLPRNFGFLMFLSQ